MSSSRTVGFFSTKAFFRDSHSERRSSRVSPQTQWPACRLLPHAAPAIFQARTTCAACTLCACEGKVEIELALERLSETRFGADERGENGHVRDPKKRNPRWTLGSTRHPAKWKANSGSRSGNVERVSSLKVLKAHRDTPEWRKLGDPASHTGQFSASTKALNVIQNAKGKQPTRFTNSRSTLQPR